MTSLFFGGQYRLEDSTLSLDLSSFSISDISLSNELEDSEILGIMEFNYVLKRRHVVGWKGISISV
jgi:hypothetical protein